MVFWNQIHVGWQSRKTRSRTAWKITQILTYATIAWLLKEQYRQLSTIYEIFLFLLFLLNFNWNRCYEHLNFRHYEFLMIPCYSPFKNCPMKVLYNFSWIWTPTEVINARILRMRIITDINFYSSLIYVNCPGGNFPGGIVLSPYFVNVWSNLAAKILHIDKYLCKTDKLLAEKTLIYQLNKRRNAIKPAYNELLSPLFHICKKSIASWCFPDKMEIAKVTLLFKQT